MLRVTAAREDYLKAILKLDPMGAGTRVVDIAEALGVSKASASRAVAKLEEMGLVQRFGKRRVALTREGETVARAVRSRYETIRLFFLEILHLHYKTAAEEACKLEHTLSDASVYAMKLMVDQNDDWAQLADALSA